jgi:spore maturation protein CgeB
MKLVFLGLSITSSWGNGHATTYRSLIKALCARGHEVLFLERNVPWYASSRDLPSPPYGTTVLYDSLDELFQRHAADVRDADAVVVGSYVPDGCEVGAWVLRTARGVRAFYDIDTPITLAALREGGASYLSPELVPQYDLYLSFTGGPTLVHIEHELGAKLAVPLYCSVDPLHYHPERRDPRWTLGYLGTYSEDRQPSLSALLLDTAHSLPGQRFVVAGSLYPDTLAWPANVERLEHVPPGAHREFYASQRFTLNLTRAEMIRAGHSPSVRLFEAAACGTPIISDAWRGLDEVLTPGREVLVAHSADDVLLYLNLDDDQRQAIGERARARILSEHTSDHRAAQLEAYVEACRAGVRPDVGPGCREKQLWAAQ